MAAAVAEVGKASAAVGGSGPPEGGGGSELDSEGREKASAGPPGGSASVGTTALAGAGSRRPGGPPATPGQAFRPSAGASGGPRASQASREKQPVGKVGRI